jgi:hypothetical protein
MIYCSTNFSIDGKLLMGLYESIKRESFSGLLRGSMREILKIFGLVEDLKIELIKCVMCGEIELLIFFQNFI